MNVNLDQKASRFKGMLSVKFSDVSLAQKSSIFKGALSVMFGDVNIYGPDMLGAPKVHYPKVGLTNKIVFKKRCGMSRHDLVSAPTSNVDIISHAALNAIEHVCVKQFVTSRNVLGRLV